MNKSLTGIFLIILACLAWALDGYFRYPLMQGKLKAEWLVFVEHSILVLVFLYPITQAIMTMLQKAALNVWGSFFMIGALGSALSTVFFSKAMFILNPSIVVVLQKLQPIIALLLAKLILKEKLPWYFLAVAALAIIGVGLLSYEDFRQLYNLTSEELTLTNDIILGYIFAFFSVIGWASATVFGKKVFNTMSLEMSVYQILGLRYFLGWLALIIYLELMSQLPWSELYSSFDGKMGTVASMVFVSAVLGMSLYYQGMKILRPRIIVIVELWYPFLAIIVNALLLDIHLQWIQIIGAVILVFATFLVQYKKDL